MIMHKSNSRCNPNFEKFFGDFSGANDNKIATPEKTLSSPKFTLPEPEQRTRYCGAIQQQPDRRLFLVLSFLESHSR